MTALVRTIGGLGVLPIGILFIFWPVILGVYGAAPVLIFAALSIVGFATAWGVYALTPGEPLVSFLPGSLSRNLEIGGMVYIALGVLTAELSWRAEKPQIPAIGYGVGAVIFLIVARLVKVDYRPPDA